MHGLQWDYSFPRSPHGEKRWLVSPVLHGIWIQKIELMSLKGRQNKIYTAHSKNVSEGKIKERHI
jgi:hypothetical protein